MYYRDKWKITWTLTLGDAASLPDSQSAGPLSPGTWVRVIIRKNEVSHGQEYET